MEHSRKRASPFTLEGLRYYTRQEAELLNWFARFFPGFADWDRWASEILGTLLERPAGLEVHLKQTHCVEQQDPKVYAVEKNETVLGRAPENDVVLAAKSVSKQHARILIRDGAYYLEDLGSQVGTYVGQRKLGPGKLQQLNQGDHFVIFPYSFAFEMRQGVRHRSESGRPERKPLESLSERHGVQAARAACRRRSSLGHHVFGARSLSERSR